jgi:hypothetical protein
MHTPLPEWVIRVDIVLSDLSSAIHNTGHYYVPTEIRLLAAFLHRIRKQRAQPPQLLRPGFAQSGDP